MYKAQIDFDSYEELKPLVCDFQPHLIGIRTLSYFKDFFHRTAALIKEWGIDAPIIAGGPYGTSDYRLVLQDPTVELTVLREGELTLAELVDKMIANSLTGIVHFHEIPGEGTLDFGASFKALTDHGFSGYASVELYHHVGAWQKALHDSYAFLSQFV